MKFALGIALLTLLAHSEGPPTVKLMGWFSEERCVRARLTAAKLGPSNPECSADCIRKGAAPVFLAENRTVLAVKDYPGVIEDLGFHIEVTGTLDADGKAIHVKSVRQLEWNGAACVRPKKPKTTSQQ